MLAGREDSRPYFTTFIVNAQNVTDARTMALAHAQDLRMTSVDVEEIERVRPALGCVGVQKVLGRSYLEDE